MNKRNTKAAALMTAVVCAFGATGCGKVERDTDVPVHTSSNSSVTSGTSDGSTESGSTTGTVTFVTTAPSADPDASTTVSESTTQFVYSIGSSDPIGTPKPGETAVPVEGNAIELSYYEKTVTVGETAVYPIVKQEINEIWTSSNNSVATVDKAGNITGVGEGTCVITVTNADDLSQKAEVKVTVKKADASSGFTYMKGILIVNKSYSIPSTYNPGGLTAETNAAFNELKAAAAADGLNMWVTSGFRDYYYQQSLYNNYVAYSGQAAADTFSARPGHSEHQTGLAIDVINASDSFTGTPEAIWLEQHCYEYGFIIRYPKGKQSITGYKYEPWHIRYVGKDFADKFRTTANYLGDPYYTLEEYFGIDSYYH